MTSEKKTEILSLIIVGGPPELDLVFSLLRETMVEVTLEMRSFRKKMDICITCIDVSKKKKHFEIKGEFYGDGVRGWSTFQFNEEESDALVEMEYELWGSFTGVYDPKKRIGYIETEKFRKSKVNRH